jgi:hypothetical protein
MKKTDDKNIHILSEEKFIAYLHSRLDRKVLEFVNKLSEKLDLLVFSGVIRDFCLEHPGELRDLDLVVKKNFHQFEAVIGQFHNLKYNRNSFGGYKIQISDINIDIWNAEDTWAFKERKIANSIFYENDLTKTCFFNFSSVVFDVKRKEFIKSKKFEKFLDTRTLDIVLEDNPYPELCVINTFYYQDKFDLKISKNLRNYLIENFVSIPEKKFESIQIKHFKEILYSHDTLRSRIEKLSIKGRKRYSKEKAII